MISLPRIAAQIYSFREFIKTPEDLENTLRKLRAIGYTAIQYSPSMAELPDGKLDALLGELGMSIPTAHCSSQMFYDDPRSLAALMKKIHCAHVAYPYPHMPVRGRTEAIAFAKKLNESAKILRSEGIVPAYHNHTFEFERFDGKFFMDILYENAPDLEAELDTHWVWRGGNDPVKRIRKMAGRVSVIHLKDYGICEGGKAVMFPVGKGALDWESILAAADESGVKWYVVEQDDDTDDVFGSFESGFRFLNGFCK